MIGQAGRVAKPRVCRLVEVDRGALRVLLWLSRVPDALSVNTRKQPELEGVALQIRVLIERLDLGELDD